MTKKEIIHQLNNEKNIELWDYWYNKYFSKYKQLYCDNDTLLELHIGNYHFYTELQYGKFKHLDKLNRVEFLEGELKNINKNTTTWDSTLLKLKKRLSNK